MKARVVNGRIVVDEPTDLPEGTELDVMLYNSEGDSLEDDERAALHRSLQRGMTQANAGQLVDADDVLAELDSSAPHQNLWVASRIVGRITPCV